MTDLEASMDRLRSVYESDRGAVELVGIGTRAVAALRKFLLLGSPSTVFQPRMKAVEALSELGEKDALLALVRSPIPSSDPAVRFGEEAVRNAALRELVRWPDVEVGAAVMDIIREHPLRGACEAAGTLRLLSAAPYLVDALADDFSRPAAEEALRCMLPEAKALLIEASVKMAMPDLHNEDPASWRRANAALHLLKEAELVETDFPSLSPLLDSDDPETVTSAASLLLKSPRTERLRIAAATLRVLPDASWFVRDEMREVLAACGPDAVAPIEATIARRMAMANGEPSRDPVLPMLVNLSRQIKEHSQ